MSFYIKIAGKSIFINNMYELCESFCKDYISIAEEGCLKFEVNRNELYHEQNKSVQKGTIGGRFLYKKTLPELEYALLYRNICTSFVNMDFIMIHGVLLAVGNSGYLITAKSGVGKTTRALHWVSEISDAIIVNGDKPLFHIGDTITGYGTPWCGKENLNVNTSVTLKGICFLERSDENKMEEIHFSQAFPKLLQQTFQPSDGNGKVYVISLIQKLKGKVRFFNMRCTDQPDAARYTYEYLQEHTV